MNKPQARLGFTWGFGVKYPSLNATPAAASTTSNPYPL
jgi:hypothetical protein